MKQVGADAVITLGAREKLVLRCVAAKTLTAGDFQRPIDIAKIKLSLCDEFVKLGLHAEGGTWILDLAEGGTTDHDHPYEQQFFVDPAHAGTSTKPLGINPSTISHDSILSIVAATIDPANATALGRAFYSSGLTSSKADSLQHYRYC